MDGKPLGGGEGVISQVGRSFRAIIFQHATLKISVSDYHTISRKHHKTIAELDMS